MRIQDIVPGRTEDRTQSIQKSLISDHQTLELTASSPLLSMSWPDDSNVAEA